MIYLLRHGEIRGASTKRFIGRTDVGLSRAGLAQAGFWQGYFSNIHMDRVFTSPLSRAVCTAKIVTGLEMNQITVTDELREIDLGQWDGKTFRHIKEKYPDQWEKRGNDLTGYRPPSGESFSDLYERILPVFHGISSENPGNILIVAHAGVNRMILCCLLNRDLKDLFTIPQQYGCLNVIENELQVQEVNLVPGEFQISV